VSKGGSGKGNDEVQGQLTIHRFVVLCSGKGEDDNGKGNDDGKGDGDGKSRK
jgi:hypothetical protein